MSDCVLGVGRLRASLLLQATTTFGTLLEQLRPHILACHKTASKCVVSPSMVYQTIPYTHEHVPKLNSEKPWQPCTCDNARCMTLTPCSTTGLFDVLDRSVHTVCPYASLAWGVSADCERLFTTSSKPFVFSIAV